MLWVTYGHAQNVIMSVIETYPYLLSLFYCRLDLNSRYASDRTENIVTRCRKLEYFHCYSWSDLLNFSVLYNRFRCCSLWPISSISSRWTGTSFLRIKLVEYLGITTVIMSTPKLLLNVNVCSGNVICTFVKCVSHYYPITSYTSPKFQPHNSTQDVDCVSIRSNNKI